MKTMQMRELPVVGQSINLTDSAGNQYVGAVIDTNPNGALVSVAFDGFAEIYFVAVSLQGEEVVAMRLKFGKATATVIRHIEACLGLNKPYHDAPGKWARNVLAAVPASKVAALEAPMLYDGRWYSCIAR
jgi:hypothetical protein